MRVQYRCVAGGISGFSLIELMIAISIIALGASFAAQSLFHAEHHHSTALITQRHLQERNTAARYIHAAFEQEQLSIDADSYQLTDPDLPEDIAVNTLLIWPVAGQVSRYQNSTPNCVLSSDADTDAAQIEFITDCLSSDNGSAVAANIELLWHKGVPVSFGIAGSSGLCISASAPTSTTPGQTASLSVFDTACITDASDNAYAADAEIIFPRYMVFSADDPAAFSFALFEPVARLTDGASLAMPEQLTIKSGVDTQINDIFLSSLSPDTPATLELKTSEQDALLWLTDNATDEITDNNSAHLQISGTVSEIKQTLEHLYYQSPNGFFGTDNLIGEMRFHQNFISEKTILSITPNCGDQEKGTAVRFDFGYWEDGSFVLTDYLTSVSLVADFPPQRYYGYCRHSYSKTRPRQIYDQQNGLRRIVTEDFSCSDTQDPSDQLTRNFATSSTAIDFDAEDTLTVFIYEETGRYTKDRFSLFFIFGDFDNDCSSDPDDGGDWAGKCEADVQLSNIEAGRDLEDIEDIFTFADDPGEYSGDNGTAIISSTGVITMSPTWNVAHDGLIIPLRLPDNDSYSEEYLPRLSAYSQDPDGDGQVNPRLELSAADTMHHWRVRAPDETGSTITMREQAFNLGAADERSVIQLNIGQSRACE